MPDARQAWRDIRLRAGAHESAPAGYKNCAFKDLADELSGSSATQEPLVCVPLTDRLITLKKKDEQTLGEVDTRDDLDRELEEQIQENSDAFNQGGLPQTQATPPVFRMNQCAPGFLLPRDWPSFLPIKDEQGNYDKAKYE